MQDPLPNIKKQSLHFQCVVNKEKSTVADSSNLYQVNWEIFLFSEPDALQKFAANPLKYCGILTDPITRQRFRPGVDSPKSEYEGHSFYFWTQSSKDMFDKMPAYYSAPNIKMEELDEQGGHSTP